MRCLRPGKRIILTEESQSCELRLLKKKEQEFFAGLDCMVVKNRDDDFRVIRGAVSDITERHLLAGALQKAHNGLEERVEERTAELRTANEELAQEIEKHRKAAESLCKVLSEIKKLKDRLEAAEVLGLHPSTLRARMHKLGIVRPEAKVSD